MARKVDLDKSSVTKDALLPSILFALLIRWCVAVYPYSGFKKPPMYGDFEAQRHWQEITLHTPTVNWYENTTQNDLQYWGLDYPPLTAYHSLLLGEIADWFDPESVRLFASRGYENEQHKLFMRSTVIVSDVYLYFSAVICLSIAAGRVKTKGLYNIFNRTDVATVMFLLYPGLILIDHGHFQYNCISLGLFLWATFFIVAVENDTLATIFFVLSLNYKQMELYHSLPFFFYLLRKCFVGAPAKYKLMYYINNLNKLAIAVISCFILIWYPLFYSLDTIKQVILRLFPLNRGIFEDKVSNVWCFINVFVKLRMLYTNEVMAKICLIVTVLAVLPSCMDLFFRINRKKFVLSLINVSLAFFLFSFQVHEKTILLVATPVALHFPEDPFMCFWFLLVSNFSMLPLLLKDGLLIPFLATNLIYLCSYSIVLKIAQPEMGFFSIFNANKVYKVIQQHKLENPPLLYLLSGYFFMSFIGMCMLIIGILFIQPPPKYPDLFPLLISVYSCCHFLMFFLYYNYQQFIIPTSLPIAHKMKAK